MIKAQAYTVSGRRMGEEYQQCVERLRSLDPASLEAARDFITRWCAFRDSSGLSWLPEEKLRVNFVANNQQGAGLFGIRVNPLHHRPHVVPACLSACVVCDREEEELPQQQAREAKPETESRCRGGAGTTRRGPSAGASDAWASGWVAQAESRRRTAERRKAAEEVAETSRREAEVQRKAVEEAAETSRREAEFQREEARELAESRSEEAERRHEQEVERLTAQLQAAVDADPEVGNAVLEVQNFLEGWTELQQEWRTVPAGKLWASHVANNPVGAVCFGTSVDLSRHLPLEAIGCLTACVICDQHKSLQDRCALWNRAQNLLEEGRALQQRQEEAARQAKA